MMTALLVAATMMTVWDYAVTSVTNTPGRPAKGLGGSVYTQTTDVEIEINGLMTYDRKVLKFDPVVLRKAHRNVIEEVR